LDSSFLNDRLHDVDNASESKQEEFLAATEKKQLVLG
jgi:hypothetical protein